MLIGCGKIPIPNGDISICFGFSCLLESQGQNRCTTAMLLQTIRGGVEICGEKGGKGNKRYFAGRNQVY